MSNPFYGYDPSRGPAPQQPQHSQQQPPPFGFPANAYNNYPYQQQQQYAAYNYSVGGNNQNPSQGAYAFNATQIPGLSATGATTSPSTSPHNAPPGISSWGNHTGPPPAPPAFSLAGSYGTQQAQVSDTVQPKPNTLDTPAIPSKSQVDDVEEGELSEGQFEDLYEESKTMEQAAHRQAQSHAKQATRKPEHYGDEGEEGEEGEITGGGTFDNTSRAQSGSYSPSLATTPPVTAPTESRPASTAPSQGPPAQMQSHRHGLDKTNSEGIHHDPATSKIKATGPGESQPAGLSEAQLKKEAQAAVLRLWPAGVRHQTYLEEGFRKEVIDEIFTDLKLNIPVPPGEAAAKKAAIPPIPSAQNGVETSQAANVVGASNVSLPTANASGGAGSKPEARNERIARLLAAQQAKKAATSGTPIAEPSKNLPAKPKSKVDSLPPDTPSAPKAMATAKTLLLQQKMAALRSKKEARGAQKFGSPAPKPSAEAQLLSAIATPTVERTSPSHMSTGQSADQFGQSLASASQHRGEQGPAGAENSTPSSVAGLSVSSTPRPTSSTGRKRPVATDFDDSSTVGAHKRPFGQNRSEKSLVIEVSDDSDDEDMEIDSDGDSQDEQPVQSMARNGPLLRDFPPLTDSASAGSGHSRLHIKKAELQLKERAIQEMRERIAQAQAKKKASSSRGQTPSQSATPAESTESGPVLRRPLSAQNVVAVQPGHEGSSPLPKVAHLARLRDKARKERRGRIISLDLPRVDNSLQAKLDRLKMLQNEESLLQAEIDKSIAEKKTLTDELAKLDAEPSESPLPSNGVNSNAPSVVTNYSLDQLIEEAQAASATQPGLIPTSRQVDVPDGAANALNALGLSSGDGSTRSLSQQASTSVNVNTLENPQPSSSVPNNAVAELAKETSPSGSSLGSQRPADTEIEGTSMEEDVDMAGASGEDSVDDDDDDVAMDESNSDASSVYSPSYGASPQLEEPLQVDRDSGPSLGSSPGPASNEDDAPEDTISGPQATLEETPQPELPTGTNASQEIARRTEASVAREVHVVSPREDEPHLTRIQPLVRSKPQSQASFVPYKSPLTHFRAFRFHPDYQSTVAGGLKSLTYSNKIDPKLEMCPHEVNDQVCPDGPTCRYQHYRAICAADDQILLELGKSEGYEDKTRFIQGLRELLQNFRANKVKDFGTIARGIIEYRAKFLGDKTKILNLEGAKL